jgi:hypothetical protein
MTPSVTNSAVRRRIRAATAYVVRWLRESGTKVTGSPMHRASAFSLKGAYFHMLHFAQQLADFPLLATVGAKTRTAMGLRYPNSYLQVFLEACLRLVLRTGYRPWLRPVILIFAGGIVLISHMNGCREFDSARERLNCKVRHSQARRREACAFCATLIPNFLCGNDVLHRQYFR